LGYPWLEAFNLPIDWHSRKIPGPQTKFKTTTAVSREHKQEAYNIRWLCLEQKEQIQKVMIAQQMAEKYYEDHKEETLQDIPAEYGHATFTIPKKDGTYRIIQDYQPINKYTQKDTTPLPNI
jgi:hypothetical protein